MWTSHSEGPPRLPLVTAFSPRPPPPCSVVMGPPPCPIFTNTIIRKRQGLCQEATDVSPNQRLQLRPGEGAIDVEPNQRLELSPGNGWTVKGHSLIWPWNDVQGAMKHPCFRVLRGPVGQVRG